MTIYKYQSKIKEVRDELSLDFAEGKYLNVISSNLGLIRPKFGFSDDTWRALVRTLALQEKQVLKKFEDVLTIMLGPKKSVSTGLAQAASVGDRTIVVTDTTGFPQLGTLVIDEYEPTEETVTYCYVDRSTNTIFLDSALTDNHVGYNEAYSAPLKMDVAAGALYLTFTNVNGFPASALPGTFVLGAGTANQESVQVLGYNDSENKVTLSAGTTNSHTGMTPTVRRSTVAYTYINNSYVLVLNNPSTFPKSGYVLVGPSANSFTATGGSTSTFVAAASTFTANKHVGSIAVFEGNVTPALAGVEVDVIANTATTLQFRTTLAVSPAAGDRIKIKQRVEYYNLNTNDGSITMLSPLYDCTYIAGTEVELLSAEDTLMFSQVRVIEGCWDVYQTTPKQVDIFICPDSEPANTVRSASYLHKTVASPTLSTTVSVGASLGASQVYLDFIRDFPEVGVLKFTSTSELAPYTKVSYSTTYASAGSTAYRIYFTTGTYTANELAGCSIKIGDFETTVESSGTTYVDLVSPVPTEVFSTFVNGVTTITVFDWRYVNLVNGYVLQNAYLVGAAVDVYEPALSGTTTVIDGNLWTTTGTFPGPYVYDFTQPAPFSGVHATPTLTKAVPAQTRLMCSALTGFTAIEVQNALTYDLLNFPYDAVLGYGTANVENISILDVNLKSRTKTTVSGNILAGVNSIPVTSLSGGGAGSGADFPNAFGYRIRVGAGTANEEILLVSRTTTGISVNPATTKPHSIGETVELLNDVLSVDSLVNAHTGVISLATRFALLPSIPSSAWTSCEPVNVLVSELAVSSTTGFPSTGDLLINFGRQKAKFTTQLSGATLVGATSAVVILPTGFTSTACPFEVVLDEGTRLEERALCTNVIGNTLYFGSGTYGLQYAHASGSAISVTFGMPEKVTYTSTTPNTFRFSSPTMLQSDHKVSESVVYSSGFSGPRTNGYDFPLRMPPSLIDRIKYVLELVRAAGIKVNFTKSR